MHRIAALDAGTNTFSLSIFDIELGQQPRLHRCFKRRCFVDLVEELGPGRIGPLAWARSLDAARTFAQDLRTHEVGLCLAAGTAALRTADNGAELVEAIAEQSGIGIELISGQREAELIFAGMRHAAPLPQEGLGFCMDIGGGSVEFMLGNQGGLHWAESFPVGIAFLDAQVRPSDPISQADIAAFEAILSQALHPLVQAAQGQTWSVITGASGSFEVLYEYCRGHSLNQAYDYFSAEEFSRAYAELRNMDIERRREVLHISSSRAKLIMPAIVLLDFLRRQFDIQEFAASDYALREGLVYDYLHHQKIL